MSLVALPDALLHLRADAGAEDTLIGALINAAELSAAIWINRNLYADSTALAAAVAGVPAALTAATTAYINACTAADQIADAVQASIAQSAADRAYSSAQDRAMRTNAGMVINDSIRSAILLIVGHLYANREASGSQNIVDLPMGVQYLLQPFKVYP